METMGQDQRTIEVRMLKGKPRDGIATGNNAAWLCVCGYKYPLIGRTGKDKSTKKNVVDCPKCDKFYYVYPENGVSQKRAVHVQECKQP